MVDVGPPELGTEGGGRVVGVHGELEDVAGTCEGDLEGGRG